MISSLVCFWSSFTNRKSCLIIIERKTFSLLATRSNLVILLLLIIIKVFRFQRKTLLLFLSFFSIIIIFSSYKFCASDFSNMLQSICVKFSGKIDIYLNFIHIFLFLVTLNITSYIDVFVNFRGSVCPWMFSETIKDISFKFSGIVEDNSQMCMGAIKFRWR